MVRTPDFTLDLVTARRESYPRPGALPSVEPAGIDEDLHRRDFSINALALRLDGAERGALVDPTGGLADLQRRRIRVIHPRSFQDDATRMLRAVRYEARLGFSIDPDTRRLLERDRPFLEAISPARLRHEMARMVAEGEGASALARTAELGLLAAIHPALSWPGSPEATGLLARSATEERLPLALAILAWDASPAQAGSIARRLAATRVESRVLRALGGLRRLLASASLAGARPSQVARALESFPTLALRAAAALEPPGPSRTAILSYLVVWSQVKAPLSGDDLLKLGVAPGPELGRLLGRLRSAALDGLVADRSDALAWVERALAPHGGRKAR